MKFVGNINTYARDTMGVSNLGVIDTLMRGAVALGIVLYLLMFVEAMTIGHVGLAMAAILIGATVTCRWDPVYHLLGWNSDELRLAIGLRAMRRAAREEEIESERGEVVTVDAAAAAQGGDHRKAA